MEFFRIKFYDFCRILFLVTLIFTITKIIFYGIYGIIFLVIFIFKITENESLWIL